MTANADLDLLARFCAEADLPWDESKGAKMGKYLDLLMQFNEAMNLIGPLSREAVVRELLLDSLVAAAARRPKGPILDVGTGAGLPGVPLKILFPDLAITLVEPRRKRSTFLKIVTHRLGLDDVIVARCRIEDLDEDHFDFVCSKAFEAPTRWLRTAKPFLSPRGAVVCMARRQDCAELVEVAGELQLEPAGSAAPDPDDKSEEARVVYAFESAR